MFHISKFEAIDGLLDVFFRQLFEHLRALKGISAFVSQNDEWQTFSKSIFDILNPQRHHIGLLLNLYGLSPQAALSQTGVFLKRLPLQNGSLVLPRFVSSQLPRFENVHGGSQLPFLADFGVLLEPLIDGDGGQLVLLALGQIFYDYGEGY